MEEKLKIGDWVWLNPNEKGIITFIPLEQMAENTLKNLKRQRLWHPTTEQSLLFLKSSEKCFRDVNLKIIHAMNFMMPAPKMMLN